MKIGVMTFWGGNNYGQNLQAYALIRYLNELGHDAFLIKYRLDGYDSYGAKFLERMGGRRHFIEKYIERRGDVREIYKFCEENIPMEGPLFLTYRELRKDYPEADLYIVGSDQVFNPFTEHRRTVKNRVNAYFLAFTDKPKIAYASSFGSNIPSPYFLSLARPLIKMFRYVSVRERSGIEICEKLGYPNAESVPDPVFLISADDWRRLYRERERIWNKEKYIFVYWLNTSLDFAPPVYEFAKEKGLRVMFATGNGFNTRNENIKPTIQEWLRLIDEAEYIITTSFHAVAFSIIFGKKFLAVPLNNPSDDRIESAFKMCGMEPRWYENDISVIERDYKPRSIPKPENFLKTLSDLEDSLTKS